MTREFSSLGIDLACRPSRAPFFKFILLAIQVSCMLILLQGCNSSGRERPNQKFEQVQTFQRFVPVQGMPQGAQNNVWSGAFALDTVTGELCFTYRDVGVRQSSIPLCRDLFDKKQ